MLAKEDAEWIFVQTNTVNLEKLEEEAGPENKTNKSGKMKFLF